MATPIQRYREHKVWEVLRLKHDALVTNRYGSKDLEDFRADLAAALETALQSEKNPHRVVYDDLLDRLLSTLSSVNVDESSMRQLQNYNSSVLRELYADIRALPGPAPRNLAQTYAASVQELLDARHEELQILRERATELRASLESATRESEQLRTRLDGAEQQSRDIRDQVSQVASDAKTVIAGEWQRILKQQSDAMTEEQTTMRERSEIEVHLLASAAQVGRRLLEKAAAQYTALEWTQRAARERRSGLRLRGSAIATFVLAGVLAGFILTVALRDGFELTVGDGILRASLVLSIGAIGTYLAAEGRRHFREADAAEEVSTALVAIEPFFADASTDDRAAARREVGDTVFVRNVLSRFRSRDASRNASNAEVTDVVDQLTKSADLFKKTSE